MIAEPRHRRCGLGREAVAHMMRFGVEALGIAKFVAKIGLANAPSLAMFEGRLGFARVSECEFFGEATLELVVGEQRPALEALWREVGTAIAPL